MFYFTSSKNFVLQLKLYFSYFFLFLSNLAEFLSQKEILNSFLKDRQSKGILNTFSKSNLFKFDDKLAKKHSDIYIRMNCSDITSQ